MRFAVTRRVIVMVVVGMVLTAAAQTNSLTQNTQYSILPESHLRIGYTERLASRSDPRDGQVSLNSLPAETRSAGLNIPGSAPFVLSADPGGGEVQRYYLRQPDFGLIPPARVSKNLMVRACDSVFRPEEFHVGRTTTVSCSVLTAIKRKNPLCLLNPIILHVTW
jgi:hypothetical protein